MSDQVILTMIVIGVGIGGSLLLLLLLRRKPELRSLDVAAEKLRLAGQLRPLTIIEMELAKASEEIDKLREEVSRYHDNANSDPDGSL